MLDRIARDKMIKAIEAYMNDEIKAFEFDDRLCEISAAIKIEPENVSFLYAIAVLHLQDENRTEAIRAVDRLIRLEPDNPQWKTLRRRAESPAK